MSRSRHGTLCFQTYGSGGHYFTAEKPCLEAPHIPDEVHAPVMVTPVQVLPQAKATGTITFRCHKKSSSSHDIQTIIIIIRIISFLMIFLSFALMLASSD